MNLSPNVISAVILGIMQDGALPHIGCQCSRCRTAFEDPKRMKYAACLAIVDTRSTIPLVWLIDATPDIKWQMQMLAPVLGLHPRRFGRIKQPDAIFLTHAHMGHLAGLAQLGPEAMAVQGLPVYGTAPLLTLLQSTRLWQPLMSNLQLKPLNESRPHSLAPNLSISALPVPHRDEWNVGTVAYKLQGPHKSLLYVPDIDSWQEWEAAKDVLSSVDYALVDATFFSAAELDGRDPVAHPPVTDTLKRFSSLASQLVLTHFNHTNPILDEGSQQRAQVRGAGALIARRGMKFRL